MVYRKELHRKMTVTILACLDVPGMFFYLQGTGRTKFGDSGRDAPTSVGMAGPFPLSCLGEVFGDDDACGPSRCLFGDNAIAAERAADAAAAAVVVNDPAALPLFAGENIPVPE